jgi:hypothetical protein
MDGMWPPQFSHMLNQFGDLAIKCPRFCLPVTYGTMPLHFWYCGSTYALEVGNKGSVLVQGLVGEG